MGAPSGSRRVVLVLCLLLVLVFYGLGVNPFFLPDTYDNILYQYAARSLVNGRGYTYDGLAIADWPPGFSLILAVPQLVGVDSVVAAKLVVLAFVALGLLLAWRLLRAYGRTDALLACAVLALTPKAFQMGTRIMAEWPYIAASFLFLLLLRRLRTTRSTPLALVTGVLLGFTALIRYTGVLLGAAVVAQAVSHLRRNRRLPAYRRIVPELVVACVGSAIFLTWIGWLVTQLDDPTFRASATNLNVDTYGGFHPLAVPQAITNLLFFSEGALNALGASHPALSWAAAVPALLALAGLSLRIVRRQGDPIDAYVVGLLLFAAVYEQGFVSTVTRYFLPLAPFLASDFLFAARLLLGRAHELPPSLRRWRPVRLGVAGWLLVLAAMDGYLLLRGGVSHRGLALESRDEGTFYTGYWHDLYEACRYIRAQAGHGAVGQVARGDFKYIAHFTGRRAVELKPGVRVAFVLVPAPVELTPESVRQLGLEPRGRFGSVRVYATIDRNVPDVPTVLPARTPR